jgi:hypothetical protein
VVFSGSVQDVSVPFVGSVMNHICRSFTTHPTHHVLPGRRCEDNSKMHRREIGCEIVDFIPLALDGMQWQVVVNIAMNHWVT